MLIVQVVVIVGLGLHSQLATQGSIVNEALHRHRQGMDIIRRDEQDMSREVSPLRKAEDAILVDSSDLTKEAVIDVITRLVEKARKA